MARRSLLLFIGLIWTLTSQAYAQTATYHLHNQASSTPGLLQLKTTGPDAPAATLSSQNLSGLTGGDIVIQQFDTQAGVPGLSGYIPTSSTITFTLWMNLTANFGTIYPKAIVNLNSASGTPLCTATGTTALNKTPTKYTLTCTTTSNVTMATTDRIYLWVGVHIGTGPGNHNVQGQSEIEGTLNGNYDSQIAVPNPVTPSITSLSLTSGTPGTPVTISGTNFGTSQGTSTVTFNGGLATPTSWSNTSIVVPVPSSASTGPVVVTVFGFASNGVTFGVPPQLYSLSPSSGPVGTSVAISGYRFGSTGQVTFSGTVATVSSWSNATIYASVPSGATSGPVVVTVGGLASTNSLTFSVSPKVTSLSTSSGAAGTSVTISGSGFGATQAGSQVTFNGVVASPSSWTSTSIQVKVPSGAVTGPVIVTVGGVTSNPVTFTVPLVLTGLTPSSGPIGTSVTISGSSFGASQGTSTVTFNGVSATPTLWSNTQIVATVPTGAATGSVVVTVNGQASNSQPFTVQEQITYVYDQAGRLTGVVDPASSAATYNYDPAGNLLSIPTPIPSSNVSISQFSPSSGVPGSTVVTINGTGFSATPSVNNVKFFNGVSANVTSSSLTQIVTTVPANASTGPISVTTSGGTATSSGSFTVTATGPGPVVTAFNPTIGKPGFTINITGNNFDSAPANNEIVFNVDTAGTRTWASAATPTSLTATVPSAAMTGHITIINPNGTGSSAADFFIPPPSVPPSAVVQATQIPIGQSTSISLNAPDKVVLLAFDGTANQTISITLSGVTLAVSYVYLYAPDGTLLRWTMTSGSSGSITGVNLPSTGTYMIVIVVPSYITTVAGSGCCFTGDGALGTNGMLYYPETVAVDSSGNLYIADQYNHRIRKVDTSGTITTVAGNGTAGYNGDNIAATSAQLYYPTGVAADASGNLYIADQWNHRIRKVTSGMITTVAGNGTAGYNGDSISATSVQLNYPYGVAVDASGNLYIADRNNHRIRACPKLS